jgi:hypothetical protein
MEHELRVTIKQGSAEVTRKYKGTKEEIDEVYEGKGQVNILTEKKKLQAIADYIDPAPPQQVEAPRACANPLPNTPPPIVTYNPPANQAILPSCPKCGRKSLREYTVKKEGVNQGKKYKKCLNKECGFIDWGECIRG